MSGKHSEITLKKGEILCSSGEDISRICLVTSGKITAYCPYGTFALGPGHVACLSDSYYGISMYNYVADMDTTLDAFSINNISDISGMDNTGSLVLNRIHHIMDMIRNYLTLIVKCRKKNSSFVLSNRIEKWELDKYNGIFGMPEDMVVKFYSQNSGVSTAFLIESARFATMVNDACLEMSDFLGINMDYVPPVVKEEPQPQIPETILSPEEEALIAEDVNRHLQGSLQKILTYSRMSSDDADDFFSLMVRFKRLPDKLTQDESVRRIRKEITDSFYELYYSVFMASLDDDNIPAYIKMFLHFGYLDEELLGSRNKLILYKLVQNIEEECNNSHVYTIYNWLKHIVWEEKQPSKNSFDQTYEEYIREQSRNGKLKVTESEALSDTDMKLKFEISNMFAQTHRITCGRISSFVPILIEENIYKPLDKCFLSGEAVINAVNYARNIDFSLFFHSIVYSNESIGLSKEYIYTEVLPDIILMPCIGTGGAMWQEIEGRHRNSSARFMLPIFCAAETESVLLNICGKYRWELCKRIQGSYWNNLSERSLTSEYYDYLQFYKKNRDLTDTAKEKVKSSLVNCRNNYPEVFAKDYEQWIMYESGGIAKLNRVSRMLMSKYCPFNAKIRDSLKLNPAYTDVIEAYERQRAAQQKHFDLLSKALTAKGFNVPREIRETRAYLNR